MTAAAILSALMSLFLPIMLLPPVIRLAAAMLCLPLLLLGAILRWLLALLLSLLGLRLWLLSGLLLLLFLLRLWLNLLLPVHRLYRLLHLCCHLLLCCSLRLRLCTRLAVSLHRLHHQLPSCIINSA